MSTEERYLYISPTIKANIGLITKYRQQYNYNAAMDLVDQSLKTAGEPDERAAIHYEGGVTLLHLLRNGSIPQEQDQIAKNDSACQAHLETSLMLNPRDTYTRGMLSELHIRHNDLSRAYTLLYDDPDASMNLDNTSYRDRLRRAQVRLERYQGFAFEADREFPKADDHYRQGWVIACDICNNPEGSKHNHVEKALVSLFLRNFKEADIAITNAGKHWHNRTRAVYELTKKGKRRDAIQYTKKFDI